MRVNHLQGLGFPFANVHLDKRPPGWTSLRCLHLLCSWFPMATPISPNHTAYWGVRGLEVILPNFIIIKGGLGHPPAEWLDWA